MNEQRLLPLKELREGVPQRCVAGDAILSLCRVNGAVYAVDDRCPHEDVSLSLGSLQGHRLRCPLHGSEFDVRSGQVLSEPAADDLRSWPVKVVDEWVVLGV